MNQFMKALRQFLRPHKRKMSGTQTQRLTHQETLHMLQQALSIRAVAVIRVNSFLTDPADTSLTQPLVWLEAQDRADIQDVGRVHQIEKEGEVELTWMGLDLDRPGGHIFLHCVFVRPIKTSFLVDFPIPDLFAVLECIGETHRLTFLLGKMPEWAMQQERAISLRDLEILAQSPDHFSLLFDEIGIESLFSLLKLYHKSRTARQP